MKTTPLIIAASLLACSLLFAGCSPAPAAVTIDTPPPTETAVPTATVEPTLPPTATPEPTATPAPTEPPPPPPCNIVFESNRDGNWEVYRMAPDGSDTINLTNDPGDDFEPAWSPDGSQIAFVSNRENGEESGQFIYIMNADGSEVRQLTTDNESRWPDWSHDGSRITYNHQGDIYVINADGSGEAVNLTNSPEEDAQSAWSPDDSQILWLSGGVEQWNIFLMNADGGNMRQLTDNGRVSDAAWAVDGRIFTHWESPVASCFNCVMDADGANVQDAGGKGAIQEFLPFWTLDGDRVECISADVQSPDSEIYLVGEIFPDIFLNLTNHPAEDSNPDWPWLCGPAE